MIIRPIDLFNIFLVSLFCVGIVFFWLFYLRSKRIMCRILKKNNQTYEVVHRQRVKLKDKSFKWNKRTYKIDPKFLIFKLRRGLELNYEFEKANPIGFHIPKTTKEKRDSSRLLTEFIQDETGAKLFSRYRDKFFVIIIIGLIATILVLVVLAFYFYNQMNLRALELAEIIANQTRGVIIG